ncbi:unnamed protein product [Cuscuta campestris]|uniref:Photosystem II Psb27 protein n=1 Tax=Cuscuta campestris TaxID=132261 RepID=A0A484MZ62_9ASTE|nr:unnamed protein product [Cuscuta campestris]
MASPAQITPTAAAAAAKPLITPVRSQFISASTRNAANPTSRREFISLSSGILCSHSIVLSAAVARAASDEEYVKETTEVIGKVKSTVEKEKGDPDIVDAVADLREASNSWVAKYRREKGLLGRPSFRDVYSALNAISGHYVSFGPTTPIPAKRKQRILEEVQSAEQALQRGR